jgi:hypothetical protein
MHIRNPRHSTSTCSACGDSGSSAFSDRSALTPVSASASATLQNLEKRTRVVLATLRDYCRARRTQTACKPRLDPTAHPASTDYGSRQGRIRTLAHSIDWPQKATPHRPRNRTFLILIALIVVVLLFSARTFLSLWVDLLWFRSLGYGQVFWTTRKLEWCIFAGFAILTFAILYGAFSALRRTHLTDLPATHTIFVAGNPIELPIAPVLRAAAAVLSWDHRAGHRCIHAGPMVHTRPLLVRTCALWALRRA